MPSRILHLAVAALLEAESPVPDPDRFHVGTVMPDAALTRAGHFELRFDGGRRKTYDLTGFRAAYGERMGRDSLYLGYYLHLAGDILQRQMLYNETGYRPTDENIPRLHRDYRLLNPVVIRKYGLRDDARLPPGWEEEPIARAIPFRLPEFLEDMRGDFRMSDSSGEKPVFFTEELADAFIHRAARLLAEERGALARGTTVLDEAAMGWIKSAQPS